MSKSVVAGEAFGLATVSDSESGSSWATARPLLLQVLVIGLVCAIPALLLAPFYHEPMSRDEGAYATVAQGLLHGQLPYRDLFDHKPPLVYVWYAASFVVFGETDAAPRFAGALFLSATALLTFGIAKSLHGVRAGAFAGLAFSFSTGIVLLTPGFNTETFMLPMLVGSLAAYMAAIRRGGQRWYALSGILGGLAVLTKSVAIWNLAFLGLICLFRCWQSDRNRGASYLPLAAMVGGAVASFLVVLAPFVLFGGAGEFIYANVSYNSLYARQEPATRVLLADIWGLVALANVAAPLVALCVLGSVAGIRRRVPAFWLIAGWSAASMLGALSTGHAFPHYYQALLPGFTLLVAPLAEGLPVTTGRARVLCLACLGIVVLLSVRTNVLLMESSSPSARMAVTEFSQETADRALSNRAIGDYLAAQTDSGESIYNYGRESQIYFYASRRPAVRYFYDRPFWLDSATLDETIAALRVSLPAYIVDTGAGSLGDSYPPSYLALLNDFYEYDRTVEYAKLFRLKD
ncbi:MAG: ArnT family glycosyltransferase [Dehalococcoidia bacterium]